MKPYQKYNKGSFSYNDKPKYWSKNKNVVNDAKRVQTVTIPTKSTTTNNQFNNQFDSHNQSKPCNNVSIQGRLPHSNYKSQREYTPLTEPIEVIFQKFVKAGIAIFLMTCPFDVNQQKPKWYNENEYCYYHRIQCHDTYKCMKLKNYIQELIDKGDFEVATAKPSN